MPAIFSILSCDGWRVQLFVLVIVKPSLHSSGNAMLVIAKPSLHNTGNADMLVIAKPSLYSSGNADVLTQEFIFQSLLRECHFGISA